MPIRIQLTDGRTVEFPDGTSQADMEAALRDVPPMEEPDADAGGPPSESVMDERGMIDKAVDYLPSVMGTIGGYAGGTKRTPTGAALSGISAAGGEGIRQTVRAAQGRMDEVPDTTGGQLARIGKVGALNAAGEVGGRYAGRKIIEGLRAIAPAAMHSALGAQTAVRKAFKNVDLDQVALREGAVVPRDAPRIASEAAQSAVALRDNLRAAGNAPVTGYDDAVSELRKLVPDARAAARGGSPEQLAAVKETLRELRGLKQRPLNAEETYVAKRAWQDKAKSAYRAQPGARAAVDPEVSKRVAQGMNATLKTANPQYAKDALRQQEMIALERALFNAAPRTSVLRDALGTAAATASGVGAGMATGNPLAGLGAGAATLIANRLTTSPTALSRFGLAANRMAPVLNSGTGTAIRRTIDPAIRQSLLALLMGDYQQ
jgi:hypothetical protein